MASTDTIILSIVDHYAAIGGKRPPCPLACAPDAAGAHSIRLAMAVRIPANLILHVVREMRRAVPINFISPFLIRALELEKDFACTRKSVRLSYIISPGKMIGLLAVLELWLSPLQWFFLNDRFLSSAHCRYNLGERQHSFQLSNIEFSQFQNSFINRCLFKFRRLHSVLQSDVFCEFCAHCSLSLYILVCVLDFIFSALEVFHVMRYINVRYLLPYFPFYCTQQCTRMRMTCSTIFILYRKTAHSLSTFV